MRNPVQFSIVTGLLASMLCGGQAPAAERRPAERPVLCVPWIESRPAIDGRLDEPSWKDSARTGPLQILSGAGSQGDASACSTEVFILRDDGHLVVGLRCAGSLAMSETARPAGETARPGALPVGLAMPAGSFIQVAKGLPAEPALPALTLECWVRPRRLDAWQTLIAQHNYPIACGYGLFVDNQGRLQLYLSDGKDYRAERVLHGPVLALGEWQHVVGTWDGKTKSLWINGRMVAEASFAGPVLPGAAPLWLGACGHNGPAVNHLQGDLAMPVIYSRALSADEIQARVRDQGRTPAAGDTVLACWPTVEKPGNRVADRSAHGRHGRVVGSAASSEFVDLLIDSTADGNSWYLIRITPGQGGRVFCAYNEQAPPWHDRTWQPQFEFAVAFDEGTGGWTAELALPFDIFSKNKTLAAEIGFHVRRYHVPGQDLHCWPGTGDGVASSPTTPPGPGDAPCWGVLTGIPPRDRMPEPEYDTRGLNRFYRPPNKAGRAFLAEQAGRTIELGPGSAHPGTAGAVRLELEGFLLAGSPHARGIIWDLAVDEAKGELYVLSDTRPVRGVAEVRVFDRRGEYLRTVMPLRPTLPASAVRDLCRTTAREMGTPLVVPKLFEPWGEPSFYGDWWHHPQKMVLASDGDLVMANIYKGILWRIRPDGSLPPRGWTSAYHAGRNEPFESTAWTQDLWMVPDLKNYLPFHALHYPYFCFDPDGALYISAGQSCRPTRQYAYHFEVSHREVSHYRDLPGQEGRGTYVWKCQPQPGPTVHEQAALEGFADPSGLVHDGQHLIVADSGHNRLRVFEADGRLAATITHYEHDGQQHPLHGPTALAMDRERCLYVLVASRAKAADRPLVERTLPLIQQEYLREARAPTEDFTRLIKLKSWREPRLLAASEPLHQDVLQMAVDSGVTPPLVWIANGAGLGSLLQLAGDDLAMGGQWGTDVAPLRCPRQSGGQPILNIDPQTGHLYVEDDSDYRLKRHGTVYRIDQEGNVLKTWPSAFFNDLALAATSPWWTLDYARHFRCPDEPLFIDSIFGKDGRVYRWKLGKGGVEILRFDRDGNPAPFAATGTNALFVDHPMQVGFWHDVYHGLEVDRHGNIYYVAKADVDASARPVSAYDAVRRQVNVYDARGEVKTRGLLRLDAVRGIQVDDEGRLYVLHRPAERPWEDYLALAKFSPSGGEPLWSRRWDSYYGFAQVSNPPCHCTAFRLHQSLDDKGYLYAAGKYSVQVIDAATGELVGEFGSYGNLDCQGKGSQFPHPELPFGTIAALSVWRDRLFVVDVVNRRIVKCRIVYDETKKVGVRIDR
ncbi:MAG: hypothetical protein GX575_31840 [Candidatus Anammoximicrobium sp.]|nr:hypothetical protein [Candidatus Anammoximicrobium sp.]